MLWLKSPKNLTAWQTPSHPLSLSLVVANGAISQYAGGATNLNLLHCAVFTSIHQVEAMPMTRVKCFYACDPPGDLMNGGAATAAATAAAALQSESNCRICIPKSFICSNEFTCVSAQAGELARYNCSRYVFESVSDLWSVTLLFTQRSLCVLEHIDMFSIFLQSFKDMTYICDTVCDSMWAGAARAA